MSQLTKWDSYIEYDHDLIKRAMAVLEDNLRHLADHTYDPGQMKRSLVILMRFGSKAHTKKEDEVLFPLLQEKAEIWSPTAVPVFRAEHEEERLLLKRMISKCNSLPILGRDLLRQCRDEGLRYLKVKAEHIRREEEKLLPLGRDVFTDADSEYLVSMFEEIDARVYGEDAHKKIERKIRDLEKWSEEAAA